MFQNSGDIQIELSEFLVPAGAAPLETFQSVHILRPDIQSVVVGRYLHGLNPYKNSPFLFDANTAYFYFLAASNLSEYAPTCGKRILQTIIHPCWGRCGRFSIQTHDAFDGLLLLRKSCPRIQNKLLVGIHLLYILWFHGNCIYYLIFGKLGIVIG